MKRLRNRLSLVAAVLFLSAPVMADECGYMPGFKHGNGGGFVALTAYVEPSVYVGPNAKVCGVNTISGNTIIDEWAEIDGYATIKGKVVIQDSAYIGEFAHIENYGTGNGIQIAGNSQVGGNAVILDNAVLNNNIQIYGHAKLQGLTTMSDTAKAYGHAQLNNSHLEGNAVAHGKIVLNSVSMGGMARACNDIILYNTAIPKGNAYCQSNNRFFKFSSGSSAKHTCAIMSFSDVSTTGDVLCWGDNSSNQISSDSQTFIDSPSFSSMQVGDATLVETGGSHTCAIRFNGQVKCWGKNDVGQLGLGTVSPTGSGFVTGISGATKLALGNKHTCAITPSGTYCWGSNEFGQLGIGTSDTDPHPSPEAVTNLSEGLQSISSGLNYTCGTHGTTAKAKCWGELSQGQIGNSSTPTALEPQSVTGLTGFGNFALKQISAGQFSVCAVDASFQVICWGNNFAGAIGNGTTGAVLPPTLVASITGDNTTKVYVGMATACAHSSTTNQLFCWGNNSQGQVGIDSIDSTVPSPTEVITDDPILNFGMSSLTPSLVTTTNAVYWWGEILLTQGPIAFRKPIPTHDEY
nr:hypothetical protein BHI3_22580 [Bacteriovorax sp. HI3]